MTRTPRFRTSRGAPIDVLLVALPRVQLLDVIGPAEAFDIANRVLRDAGRPPAYTLRLASPSTKVTSATGIEVVTTELRRARAPHTLLLGGSLELIDAELPAPWLASLGRLAKRAQRVASVCAGAFVLGRLGLLDGRRCTTHWMAVDKLRARFPTAQVEDDALYTHDGRVSTSAGVTSGIDLALSMIERDHGPKLALAVARLLVMFLHRPGGQSQFSAALTLRTGANERLRDTVAKIVERPGLDHSVTALAKRCAMSPRHFARVFRAQAGVSPGTFVERARIDAARDALERTDLTVDAIADACGFGTAETLRRVFQRTLRVSPASYRQRFQRG